MKIIANACQGAEYYRDILKEKYNVPFIWSSIMADDFIMLASLYNSLDFTNIKLVKFKDYVSYSGMWKRDLAKKDFDSIYGIRIEDKVNVFFEHNLLDESKIVPTKIGTNVFYKDNDKLTLDNWKRRTLRMTNEEPIFFVITHEKHFWDLNKVKRLLEIPGKMVIITQFREVLKIKLPKDKLIHVVNTTDESPSRIVKRIENFTLDFSR